MNWEYLEKTNQKHLKEINHANNRTNGQYKKTSRRIRNSN